MVTGTTFGTKHSLNDLDLITQQLEIGPAEPKTNYVSVPGMDGSLDLTEALGIGVTYADRTIKWTFAVKPGEDFVAKRTEVCNALNGKRMQIKFDNDPNYYFDGRVKVESHTSDNVVKHFTVSALCKPYKLKTAETTVTKSLTTTNTTITLTNEFKPAVPVVTVTASTVITYGTTSITLAAGTYTLYDFIIPAGTTSIRAKTTSGTGTITIKYREGAL